MQCVNKGVNTAREERVLRYGRVENVRRRTGRPGEHSAEVIPPPNYLTDEQLAAFKLARPDLAEPSGEQTPEQARNFAVWMFGWVCSFDGIGVPSDEAIEAEIRLRRGGVAG
jgi:hypothetical protein